MAHILACPKGERSEEFHIWKTHSYLVLALEHAIEYETGKVDLSNGEDPPLCIDCKGRKLIEMPDLWENVGEEDLPKYEGQPSEISSFHIVN